MIRKVERASNDEHMKAYFVARLAVVDYEIAAS
jgi:hypothetical protein